MYGFFFDNMTREMITCFNNWGDEVTLPSEKFFLRPSVYGVFKRDDLFLTCRNRSSGKIWFPGGGVDEGESLEQALRREVMEEVRLNDFEVICKVDQIQNYYYYEPTDEAMDAQLHFYSCTATDFQLPEDKDIDDIEVIDWAWRTIEEIDSIGMNNLTEQLISILKRV